MPGEEHAGAVILSDGHRVLPHSVQSYRLLPPPFRQFRTHVKTATEECRHRPHERSAKPWRQPSPVTGCLWRGRGAVYDKIVLNDMPPPLRKALKHAIFVDRLNIIGRAS